MLAAASTALLAGGAAYLDGQLRISSDVCEIVRQRLGKRNLKRAMNRETSPCFNLFKANAQKYASYEAIWTRNGSFSWQNALDMVCKYASYFRSQGVGPGDIVTFYLINSAELIFGWMALVALGAAPALINYNLEKDALVRCVEVGAAKLMVVDANADCHARAFGVQKELSKLGVRMVVLNDELKLTIKSLAAIEPTQPSTLNTTLAIMYTSGSTGLPKAMLVGIQRAYCTASVSFKTFGQKAGPHGDRSFYCIPLYHGTGGIAAMIDFMGGLSIAVVPKFSLSRFWEECINSKSTIVLYVGEIMRYLLSAKPTSSEKKHYIRLIWGNGLRPDVWTKVQERFGIVEVGEFYAQTEGMLTLVNHSRNGLSKGAVGHQGYINRLQTRKTYTTAQIDGLTGDMYRDPITGLARETPLSEGGEVLVRVQNREDWRGYYNGEEATDRKFVKDVLQKGDLFYSTGDALRRTTDGYWYFLDRLGDTYRWKGENVSTTEVAEILGGHPMVSEANVYGVSIPGHEGKVGCVALRLSVEQGASDQWQSTLVDHLRSNLPAYAVPVFVRLITDSESMMTGNHKYIKGPLQQEGIDPGLTGTKVAGGEKHRMFWLPHGAKKYEIYGSSEWSAINQSLVKL
ncbi:Isopenicillin N epimerase component 1 [Acrodontium crateriforme]|uniref:Isopenicillin N epimerase component 1 n=1 Tax=Acrodontium crateriforme TaxID=150365 RepID=A0AAQ3R8U7_9PEZI|nr:Isopenicillin N epimerase component 1 [Acrodontium crateriforme]